MLTYSPDVGVGGLVKGAYISFGTTPGKWDARCLSLKGMAINNEVVLTQEVDDTSYIMTKPFVKHVHTTPRSFGIVGYKRAFCTSGSNGDQSSKECVVYKVQMSMFMKIAYHDVC